MSASPSPLLTEQTDSSTSPSPPSTHPHPSIPILTGLRGVLCFWILLHNMEQASHIIPGLVPPPELWEGWMVTSGSSAVSMFFVLSGFVLLYSYGSHSFDGWKGPCTQHFLMKRYARLMPLYWLSTLMGVGFEVLMLKMGEWQGGWTIAHWVAVALGCNTWFPWPLYGTGPFAVRRGILMFNPTLWSIQTELGFYVLFPSLTRALRYALGLSSMRHLTRGSAVELEGRFIRLSQLFVVFTVLGLVPTLLWLWDSGLSALLYAMPWLRVSEFVLGMLVCALYLLLVHARTPSVHAELSHSSYLRWASSSSSPLFSRVTLDIAVVVLSTAFIALGKSGWDPRLLASNPGSFGTPLSLLLLLMVLTHSPLSMQPTGLSAWLLTRRWLVQLGVLSFAFYAFHGSAITYTWTAGQPVNLSIPLNFACALGLAVMGHYLVEKPLYDAVTTRISHLAPCCEAALEKPSSTVQ